MAEYRTEAEQALSASTWQRQKWGQTGDPDDRRSANWEMERAKVAALLDLADAIREQSRPSVIVQYNGETTEVLAAKIRNAAAMAQGRLQ